MDLNNYSSCYFVNSHFSIALFLEELYQEAYFDNMD